MSLPEGEMASLELVYGDIRRQLAGQAEQIAALDRRTHVILLAATLLTVVTGLQDVLVAEAVGFFPLALLLLFTGASLVLYVRAITGAVQSHGFRVIGGSPDPRQVWADAVSRDVPVSLKDLIGMAVQGFERMESQIRGKEAAVQHMTDSLRLQAVAVALLVGMRVLIGFIV